jgi:hypothetical protein
VTGKEQRQEQQNATCAITVQTGGESTESNQRGDQGDDYEKTA